MRANYVRLFKLLLDRGIRKGELCKIADISGTSLTKLTKGENVNTEILVRVCNALRCDFADIMTMEFDDIKADDGIGDTLDEKFRRLMESRIFNEADARPDGGPDE